VLAEALATATDLPEEPAAPTVVTPPSAPVIRVVAEDGGYRVSGDRVVTFAEMMPVEDDDARAELWRRLGRWGVVTALRRAGARPGALVRIGEVEVRWEG
jgi:GTP-binding protein